MAALKRMTEESREHLFTVAGYRPDMFARRTTASPIRHCPSAWIPKWL